jgi:DNA-binding NtrC family response regulator
MKQALIVDDDARILALATRWLAASDMDVATASNYADARNAIRLHAPDIVVTDIRLGEFNGIQLGILAREVRPDVRLVIMSGFDDPVLRRDIDDLHATFLAKPVRQQTLLSALNDLDASQGTQSTSL